MNGGDVIARSSIARELRKNMLVKGTLFGVLGMGILLFTAVFLPIESLRIWGFPLFLLGGCLITYGMLPYRKLLKMEMNPYELRDIANEKLLLTLSGKKILSIPIAAIEEITFIKTKNSYGMGFAMKKENNEKIIIHDPKYRPQNLSGLVDLFLPYFTERAVDEVKSCLNQTPI